MTFARTLLICSLVGVCALGACDDEEPGNEQGMWPSLPGGMSGGTGGPGGSGGTQGGTQGGISGTQGGISGTQGGISGTQGGISGTQGGISGTQGGTGGTTGGTGGTTGGTGGTTGGTGGTTGGTTGGMTGGTGGTIGGTAGGGGTCPGLPNVTNYDMPGPFGSAAPMSVAAGDEGCTLHKPANLGMGGFKHPVVVWGNGIITTPDMYKSTLDLFASHGFVTIACNSSYPERPCLNDCMEWLVKQNDSGDMAGKLDVTKELTMGYSWGGGASIDTADRPNVKATVSFHGMPPRNNPWSRMKSPLLLFTSVGDTFVSADSFVTPNYMDSQVPTFYATLNESVDHLYIIDPPLGGNAAKERGPAIAWFRYWACGDENAKKLFFGSDCTLCKAPWMTQKKPTTAWQ
jgi:hypothetical protein